MSDCEIVVRALEPQDAADIHEIFNQPRAVWGTLMTPFMPLTARQRRLAETPPNMIRLVAQIEGKVIGECSMLREERPRRAHTANLGMVVHDAYAGRGAGSAMMQALVDLADNWWNIKRLELSVFDDNARAIALYERFGFEREGLLRAYGWRAGQYVDCLAMARLRL